MHKLDLRRLRLLDLQDQVGFVPQGRGVADGSGALRLVLGVGDRAALARPRLDQHLVAVLGELAGAGGGERDAVLVLLELGRHSDPHAGASSRISTSKTLPRASSSSNISSGSRQRSGGSTPCEAIRPRARSRTAAAAGAAVETTPPPRLSLSTRPVTE